MIVTRRLVLRQPTMDECEEYYFLFSRPELNIYKPTGPNTDISHTRDTLQTWMEDWERDGIGYFTVRLRTPTTENESPHLVGYVGVAKRPFDEHTTVLNFAYQIHTEYQGCGLVAEACRAVLQAAAKAHPANPTPIWYI